MKNNLRICGIDVPKVLENTFKIEFDKLSISIEPDKHTNHFRWVVWIGSIPIYTHGRELSINDCIKCIETNIYKYLNVDSSILKWVLSQQRVKIIK